MKVKEATEALQVDACGQHPERDQVVEDFEVVYQRPQLWRPWQGLKAAFVNLGGLWQGFFLVIFLQTLVNLFSETLSLRKKSLSLEKKCLSLDEKFGILLQKS